MIIWISYIFIKRLLQAGYETEDPIALECMYLLLIRITFYLIMLHIAAFVTSRSHICSTYLHVPVEKLVSMSVSNERKQVNMSSIVTPLMLKTRGPRRIDTKKTLKKGTTCMKEHVRKD